MNVFIYATNVMALYCIISVGMDITGMLFGGKAFFFNQAPHAIPFFVITWIIILFHKPTRNIFEQQDFINLRKRIIELGCLMFVILLPFSYFYLATKGYNKQISERIFYTAIGTFTHIAVFYFSLFTGTYSQVFSTELGRLSIPKSLASFSAVFCQTLVIGGLIFFGSVFIWVMMTGANPSPVQSQNNDFWDLATKAAAEHEIAIVKKTCTPMPENVLEDFRYDYYNKLRNEFKK